MKADMDYISEIAELEAKLSAEKEKNAELQSQLDLVRIYAMDVCDAFELMGRLWLKLPLKYETRSEEVIRKSFSQAHARGQKTANLIVEHINE